MQSTNVHAFDPFSLQHGSKAEFHRHIQEVIDYGTSRLRRACIDIASNESRRQLMKFRQGYLLSELVRIYLYIEYLNN